VNGETGSALDLHRNRPVTLRGQPLPSTLHAIVAASDQDPAYRAHVATLAAGDLDRARQRDDAWADRATDVTSALLRRHVGVPEGERPAPLTPPARDALLALIASGSRDLEETLTSPTLGGPDGDLLILALLDALRIGLQRRLAGSAPTCPSCTHARAAMNPAVVACCRDYHPYDLSGRPHTPGPVGVQPYATGWGRPGYAPFQEGKGVLHNDLPRDATDRHLRSVPASQAVRTPADAQGWAAGRPPAPAP